VAHAELRVGIIGSGSIGHTVAMSIARGAVPGASVRAIAARTQTRAVMELARATGASLTKDPLDLPELRANVVLEAAGVDAAKEYVIPLLEADVDVVVMSVGALVDAAFRRRVTETARRVRRRVYVPSGGIAALDGIRAAALGSITQVTLTSRKAPESLRGAPFLQEHQIDIDAIQRSTVLFEGPAAEAIRGFPANVNVAVAVGLAVGDPGQVRVRVIAEPGLKEVVQELEVRGDFGELRLTMRNQRSRENPRTSVMSAFSALAVLRRIVSPIQIA
jgi:aspartate dehydrogenase